uniref:Uncharacterized protein n=1 Tax=Anguilla anguilla TaxID=7936 RepID=A0A0E9SJ58_ANGAN
MNYSRSFAVLKARFQNVALWYRVPLRYRSLARSITEHSRLPLWNLLTCF